MYTRFGQSLHQCKKAHLHWWRALPETCVHFLMFNDTLKSFPLPFSCFYSVTHCFPIFLLDLSWEFKNLVNYKSTFAAITNVRESKNIYLSIARFCMCADSYFTSTLLSLILFAVQRSGGVIINVQPFLTSFMYITSIKLQNPLQKEGN